MQNNGASVPDQALVATQSSPQAVSTERFDPSRVVVHHNSKRYSVFLRRRPDGGYYAVRVSVFVAGSYSRAGWWRRVDAFGRVGTAVTASAIGAADSEAGAVHESAAPKAGAR